VDYPYTIEAFKFLFRCMMTLTRGHGSNRPCTVCLIPPARLAYPNGEVFEPRTKESMMRAHFEAFALKGTVRRNEALKEFGLRGIEVFSVFNV
jgi:hypothetical protein